MRIRTTMKRKNEEKKDYEREMPMDECEYVREKEPKMWLNTLCDRMDEMCYDL